jgi:hypothetical protein
VAPPRRSSIPCISSSKNLTSFLICLQIKMAETRSSCRLSARLRSANLTYDELLRVAEDLLHEASPPARASIDALLSLRNPLPKWAVNSVLVSTDLIPYLFASLEIQDWAAACVCKAWQQGWADTAQQRRGLRAGRQLGEPGFALYGAAHSGMAAHPSGEWLAISRDWDMVLLDPAMRTIKTLDDVGRIESIAVSDEFIYITHAQSPGIQSYNARPPFAWVRENTLEDENHMGMRFPCLGPNSMLYAIAFHDVEDYEDGATDEVLAVDAGTLDLRLRFGGGKFKAMAGGMTVVGEELYVRSQGPCCTSMAGCTYSRVGAHMLRLR